jgi:hypothetical protein
MKSVGNARARAIWEGKLPNGMQVPDETASRTEMDIWIRDKYVNKRYFKPVRPSDVVPIPVPRQFSQKGKGLPGARPSASPRASTESAAAAAALKQKEAAKKRAAAREAARAARGGLPTPTAPAEQIAPAPAEATAESAQEETASVPAPAPAPAPVPAPPPVAVSTFGQAASTPAPTPIPAAVTMDLLSGFGPGPASADSASVMSASFGTMGVIASATTPPPQAQPSQQQFDFMQQTQPRIGGFGQPAPASAPQFAFTQQASQQPTGVGFGQPQQLPGFGQQPSLPLGASSMGAQVDGVKLSASQLQAQQAHLVKQVRSSNRRSDVSVGFVQTHQ